MDDFIKCHIIIYSEVLKYRIDFEEVETDSYKWGLISENQQREIVYNYLSKKILTHFILSEFYRSSQNNNK